MIQDFIKHDENKLRYDLIDSRFMLRMLNETPTTKHSSLYCKRRLYELSMITKLYSFQVSTICLFQDFVAQVDNYNYEDALARVLTWGAKKYPSKGWRECKETGKFLAAAHRHNNCIIAGDPIDRESGLKHLDHILANLMFLYVLGLTYEEDKS